MTRRREGTPIPWPLVLLAALMLGYLVAPVLTLLGALPAADLSAYLGSGALPALKVTLIAATAAALADAVLGIPLGFWLARTESKLRHTVTACVLLPLALPPVVGGLALILAFGPQGWIGKQLDRLGLVPLDNLAGTILAQMFVAAPFVVLSARAAFSGLDPSIEDAARTLGCTPVQTFIRVLLPGARRGLATGLVLGWVRCLGELGATAVVAYHPYTLPVLTYVRLTGEGLSTALPAGAVLALVGGIAAGTILWLDVQARKPGRAASQAKEAVRAHTPLSWISPPRPASPGDSLGVRAALALDGFGLDVDFETPASVVAVLGASGAGKSVTLRVIAGLLGPKLGRVATPGRVLLDTHADIDVPPDRRNVAYVAQEGGLFQHLDVQANVGFALHRLPESARRQRVDELIASFGLERVRYARTRTLSGGERHRVSLARALAADPSLLLLDEPFNSLDAPVRRELRRMIRELHERTGVPVLLVTHDRDDALDLADHVVVLKNGRVLQIGPTEEVFARPATPSVARLLGIPNVLEVRKLQPAGEGRVKATTNWGDLLVDAPEHPGGPWKLAIPADAVDVQPEGKGSRILSVRRSTHGFRVLLEASANGEELEAMVARSRKEAPLLSGRECSVSIDAARCQLMPGDAAR